MVLGDGLHAALGEDGRTDGSENGDDDLNDLFPSFFLHSFANE